MVFEFFKHFPIIIKYGDDFFSFYYDDNKNEDEAAFQIVTTAFTLCKKQGQCHS